jgi:phospholipase/carboxylesterase
LPDTHVFMSFGRNDPIVSLADSAYVQEIFTSRGAVLSTVWTPSHQLTYEEVEHSRTWLTKQ